MNDALCCDFSFNVEFKPYENLLLSINLFSLENLE